MIRIIVSSTENGNIEDVFITDEDNDGFDDPAEDLVMPGYSVDIDEKIDVKFPSGFPMGYRLTRN